MALSNRINFRGGQSSPEYVTTGLISVLDRVSIESGGYYIKNNVAYFDIVLKIMVSGLQSGALVMEGLPLSAVAKPGSGETDVTAISDNIKVVQSSVRNTCFLAAGTLALGSVHNFKGSYTLA